MQIDSPGSSLLQSRMSSRVPELSEGFDSLDRGNYGVGLTSCTPVHGNYGERLWRAAKARTILFSGDSDIHTL